MKRYASIDIGTNTVLMVIADVTEEGKLNPVYEAQEIPRLGRNVDTEGVISEESLERLIQSLKVFKRKATELQSDEVLACGTSALRDAQNREEIIAQIMERTGIQVNVISGDTEAEYTYLGAITSVTGTSERIGVLDIGGGSTELVIGTGPTIIEHYSINIGCVRLTERFFPSLPPTDSQLQNATEFIQREVRIERKDCRSIDRLIGVAGTVTTLAAIDKNLERFSAREIEQHRLSLKTIETLLGRFRGCTIDEMKKMPQVAHGREDILLSGVLILYHYMGLLGSPEITVSTRGLRYGQILAHLQFFR